MDIKTQLDAAAEFIDWMDRTGLCVYRSGFAGCYDISATELLFAYRLVRDTGDDCLRHLDAMRAPSYERWSRNGLADGELESLKEVANGDSPWGLTLTDEDLSQLRMAIAKRDRRESYEGRRETASAHTSKRSVRQRIFERDGRECRGCGATDDLTLDHIMPVIAGGDNDDSNLQVLCRSCNSRKGGDCDSSQWVKYG